MCMDGHHFILNNPNDVIIYLYFKYVSQISLNYFFVYNNFFVHDFCMGFRVLMIHNDMFRKCYSVFLMSNLNICVLLYFILCF